ncbi:MAG: hypothetical protein MZV64_43575 [Ignavibacteriales bacterium]|nr:hypothetical protein [Ignavibacteriales bacterium]
MPLRASLRRFRSFPDETRFPQGRRRRPRSGASPRAGWPGLSWRAGAAPAEDGWRPAPLKVKPILVHEIPQRRPQTSWRSWGGIATEADARAEVGPYPGRARRPGREGRVPDRGAARLADTPGRATWPRSRTSRRPTSSSSTRPAAGWTSSTRSTRPARTASSSAATSPARSTCGTRSSAPATSRQHTDALAVKGVDEDDVVIDSQDEILWRLRALAGLQQHHGHQDPGRRRPGRLGPAGRRRAQARRRQVEVRHRHRALRRPGPAHPPGPRRRRGRAPGAGPGPTPTSARPGRASRPSGRSSRTAFSSTRSSGPCMKEAGCRALTINGCMGTIMPLAETSACLTLSTLNDDGYLAFCESDFVVIPSGVLLANIAGPAGVPQRPDLPARRHHHPGPLHGAAEDGRPDGSSRPAS